MNQYVGICPSSSGGFQAKQVIVYAEDIKEAYEMIWSEIVGSRYVSRIVLLPEGLTVWEEGQDFE